MTTASGTSNGGYQVLLTDTTGTAGLFSIWVPGSTQSPPVDIGYYYLFVKASGAGTPVYVMGQGIIYNQGVITQVLPNLLISGSTRYIAAKWKYSGISWSAAAS